MLVAEVNSANLKNLTLNTWSTLDQIEQERSTLEHLEWINNVYLVEERNEWEENVYSQE